VKPYALPSLYGLSALAGFALSLLSDGPGDIVALCWLVLSLYGITRALRRGFARDGSSEHT